jgi:hypothetical protein
MSQTTGRKAVGVCVWSRSRGGPPNECAVLISIPLPPPSPFPPSPQPVFPYFRKSKGVPPPMFFGKDDFLGLFVALVMGLQHALAMVGGLITPPLLISNLAFGTRPGTTIPYSSGNPAETQRCECAAVVPVT